MSAADPPEVPEAPEPSLIDKLHERRERHRRRSPVIRVLYAIAGVLLVLAGLAMLVLPGPAFLVIPAGLFLLALEFDWAEAALETALREAEKAKVRTAATPRWQKVAGAVAFVVAVAGLSAWAFFGDIPVLPV